LNAPTRCRLAGILVNEDLVVKITGLVVIENNKIWRHIQKGTFFYSQNNNRARSKEYDQTTFVIFFHGMLGANTLFFWYSFRIISGVLAK